MMTDSERTRLDGAARAGWLYYAGGHTQDEIAKKMNVSRQTAQRLVSLSLRERLITFRLEHPIAVCMELAKRVRDRYELEFCDIVPDDLDGAGLSGLPQAAAAFLEQRLRERLPTTIALGAGRLLRDAVEQVQSMDCPHHQLVSLIGNISYDGSAKLYNTVGRLAEITNARHFLMPLPVFMASEIERERFLGIDAVRRFSAVANNADVRLVEVGQIDLEAQLLLDGFISHEETVDLMRRGAVGEIAAWAYDNDGNVIEGGTNERVTSVRPQTPSNCMALGIAGGQSKVAAIRGALRGGGTFRA